MFPISVFESAFYTINNMKRKETESKLTLHNGENIYSITEIKFETPEVTYLKSIFPPRINGIDFRFSGNNGNIVSRCT